MKKQITYKSVLILFFMMYSLTISPVIAQISIPQMTAYGYQLKHTYSQDFNSLPATGNSAWVNGSTLPGWYATQHDGANPTAINSSNNYTRGVALYSFGNIASTDRALGGHGANGWGGYYYAARFKNNSGKTIKHIKVSFAMEQWYWTKTANSPFSFSYKKGANVADPTTATGWTSVNTLSGVIATTSWNNSAKETNGNDATYRVLRQDLVMQVNLAPGEEIMLRWNQEEPVYESNNKNEYPSIALDDVQIEFVQNDVFYAIGKNLNNSNNWSIDGTNSGRKPVNFTDQDQLFVVATAGNYKLNGNLTISGLNSKLILGEETAIATLTVPFKYKLATTVDIANGSTLTINHETDAPTFGNLAPNSNVEYNTDSTNAPIQGNYGNLHITGGKEKVIDMSVQVRGKLKLVNTGVQLQNATITLENGATIEHTGEAAFIKIGAGSSVKQYLQPGNTRFLPVGTQRSYTPLRVTLPADKAGRYVSVAVEDGIYVHYNGALKGLGEPLHNGLVNKVWHISQEGATSPDAEVTFYWNVADELPNFDRTMAEMAYYNGSDWESAGGLITASAGARTAASLPANAVTLTNARSGMYGVWQPPRNPLPVELTSFTAKYKDGLTTLNWTTASERSSNYFSVEVSTNGKHFSEAGQIKAAGFSSGVRNYTFVHQPADQGIIYYRLVEYAEDGEKTYSRIVSVNAKENGPVKITAYPNPGHGKLYLTSATIKGAANLVLTNLNGKIILSKTIVLSAIEPTEIDMQHLPAGVYIIQLQSSAGRQTIRLAHLPK
ncbi:T9SS type A sorting domain-containing protein [Pontibacter populi]|uniref:T9SS type A sorting domain-containing protein n=1 Tax=Pontibacter populi TaxID=890055 RepID=A0ABV1RS60_9BACT